jgi:hypothetical protein
MKNSTTIQAQKAYKELKKAILQSDTSIRKDYVIGLYRYWAKIDAIENALLKKKILTKEEIYTEEIPILKAMKKDFPKNKK